jgi:ATP-dependent Clp protease ATP-binding subunit ClpC
MFERYTERARRAIFFARYEASNYGSRYIETEHLLLGLLREDHALATWFPGESDIEPTIRAEI